MDHTLCDEGTSASGETSNQPTEPTNRSQNKSHRNNKTSRRHFDSIDLLHSPCVRPILLQNCDLISCEKSRQRKKNLRCFSRPSERSTISLPSSRFHTVYKSPSEQRSWMNYTHRQREEIINVLFELNQFIEIVGRRAKEQCEKQTKERYWCVQRHTNTYRWWRHTSCTAY